MQYNARWSVDLTLGRIAFGEGVDVDRMRRWLYVTTRADIQTDF